MCRHDRHRVSQATVLRLLRDEGLLLEVTCQRERRQLAARRKAAFATEPTGPNQVWQLDFSPVRDHRRRHVAAGRLPGLLVKVRAGLACGTDGQLPRRHRRGRAGAHRGGRLAGRPLLDLAERKTEGNVLPLVTIVTDNGGPFRSFSSRLGVPPACGGSSPPTPSCATSAPG
jgi:putative transposase